MTSKERVMACFQRKNFDRAPVINPTSIANVECMELTSAYFPHVHTDSQRMAALASAGHDILGFDTVSPYFSVLQESSALGCDVNWGSTDTLPSLHSHPLESPEDFKMPEDFFDRKPIRTVLEAIKLLKKKYGDEVAVVGKVMGPWALSYQLHGIENFLMKTVLEPQVARDFLNVLKQVSLAFAAAQFEAGADIITWADHATGDLVSPSTFRDLLFPVHVEINKELKKSGPIILHICGKTLDRLDYIADSGFDCFHFDSKNDLKEVVEKAGDRIHLTGCVNNPKVLLNGTPEDVKSQVFEILDSGIRLVSPECAITPRTPNKNLAAIVEAVNEYKG